MVVKLERAEPHHLDAVLELVRAFHAEEGVTLEEERRSEAVNTLLNARHYGYIFLIYAEEGLIGYLVVCFGYSIEFAGRDAFIDELYVIPEARGRGRAGLLLRSFRRRCRKTGLSLCILKWKDRMTVHDAFIERLDSRLATTMG